MKIISLCRGTPETDAPGRITEEEDTMEKTIVSISQDARYFFRRAMDAETRNNPVQVIEYFDRAISMEPGYAMAWNEKGNYLDLVGKFNEALTCYDTALKLEPEDAEIWFNKGLTLKKIGREKDAVSCINRGIELAIG
jgi:tetratricopeptide (TPR) repeat protein